MSEDTPATSTDNALGTEGDSNQLPGEDTLFEAGADDNQLDEPYAPPETPRPNHFGETPWEEEHGESLDQRLAEETPEVWEQAEEGRRQPDLAGRLVSDTDTLDGQANDTFADAVAMDVNGASAEEAAIHVVDEP